MAYDDYYDDDGFDFDVDLGWRPIETLPDIATVVDGQPAGRPLHSGRGMRSRLNYPFPLDPL